MNTNLYKILHLQYAYNEFIINKSVQTLHMVNDKRFETLHISSKKFETLHISNKNLKLLI